MTRRGRFRRFVKDLFEPIDSTPVVPRPPKPIATTLLTQAVVADVIGSKAPLVDKIAFVASPHIVQGAARWGAEEGARRRGAAIEGVIDTEGRTS